MKRIVSVAIVVLLLGAGAGAVAAPARAFDRATVETAVLHLINRTRAAHGLHAVRMQPDLDRAAIAHSRQMLSLGYFSHYSAGGATYVQRLRAAGYTAAGYRSWSAGEVIGWGTGIAGTAQMIFSAWMHSSGHRAVILTPRWRDVGIGCARGTFRGRPGTLMYTVDFGRRIR